MQRLLIDLIIVQDRESKLRAQRDALEKSSKSIWQLHSDHQNAALQNADLQLDVRRLKGKESLSASRETALLHEKDELVTWLASSRAQISLLQSQYGELQRELSMMRASGLTDSRVRIISSSLQKNDRQAEDLRSQVDAMAQQRDRALKEKNDLEAQMLQLSYTSPSKPLSSSSGQPLPGPLPNQSASVHTPARQPSPGEKFMFRSSSKASPSSSVHSPSGQLSPSGPTTGYSPPREVTSTTVSRPTRYGRPSQSPSPPRQRGSEWRGANPAAADLSNTAYYEAIIAEEIQKAEDAQRLKAAIEGESASRSRSPTPLRGSLLDIYTRDDRSASRPAPISEPKPAGQLQGPQRNANELQRKEMKVSDSGALKVSYSDCMLHCVRL